MTDEKMREVFERLDDALRSFAEIGRAFDGYGSRNERSRFKHSYDVRDELWEISGRTVSDEAQPYLPPDFIGGPRDESDG